MKENNRIFKFGVIVVLLAIVASCKKDNNSAPVPTISINIQSPVEGAVFQHGDTLHITADVTSPIEVHGYEWKIKDKTSGAELKVMSDHTHGKQFTITGEYINNVAASVTAELEIIVEIDHEGDQTAKSVSFILNN